MVINLILLKDFNIFIWIKVDGTCNQDYLATVTMEISIFTFVLSKLKA